MDSSDKDTHTERTQPSTARAATTSEDDGDWSDEAIVSSLNPPTHILNQPAQAVPLSSRHLSRRDKLLRGSAVVLAVLLVLAVVIVNALRSGAFMASHDSSSNSRQVTTLAAHPAVQLSASPWEQIALPPSPNVSWSFEPVPSDPSSVFACATSSATHANGTVQPSPAKLWRSHDAGAHWQPVAISLPGSACSIQAVSDTQGHVLVLAEVYSQLAAAQGKGTCSSLVAFISRDGGDTWVPVPTQGTYAPAHTGAYCSLTITPHHLYLAHYYVDGTTLGANQHTLLERSDDGVTWVRANNGIGTDGYFYPTFVSGSTDDVAMATAPFQHGEDSGVAVWRSTDGGLHWQHLGDTEQLSGLVASQEPPAHRSDLASHALYGLERNTYIPERVFATRVLQSGDGQHWEALPMLPIAGADPDHIGVLETLGVATGGTLLFLGADPHLGIPRAGSDSATWRGDTQWLWAWDPRAQRWEVPQTPLQVAWPASCAQRCWQPHLSWGSSPDGTGYGTYVWVMRQGDATIYRTFMPASQ